MKNSNETIEEQKLRIQKLAEEHAKQGRKYQSAYSRNPLDDLLEEENDDDLY